MPLVYCRKYSNLIHTFIKYFFFAPLGEMPRSGRGGFLMRINFITSCLEESEEVLFRDSTPPLIPPTGGKIHLFIKLFRPPGGDASKRQRGFQLPNLFNASRISFEISCEPKVTRPFIPAISAALTFISRSSMKRHSFALREYFSRRIS